MINTVCNTTTTMKHCTTRMNHANRSVKYSVNGARTDAYTRSIESLSLHIFPTLDTHISIAWSNKDSIVSSVSVYFFHRPIHVAH